VPVKNIYEVLRQKEIDCARVQAEIEALRMVIPLVDGEQPATADAASAEHESEALSSNESTGTEGPTFAGIAASQSGFWRRRRESKA
jgi:hypothetical protein